MLEGILGDMTQDQREQFRALQRRFDEVMLGQEASKLAANAQFEALSRAEQESMESIKAHMDGGFDQARSSTLVVP